MTSFDAVVVVRVTEAAYISPTWGQIHPWQATAQYISTQEGKAPIQTYTFGRTGSSAACDDGQGLPSVNETWVLYLRKTNNGWHASASYPLSFALVADKRFTRKP